MQIYRNIVQKYLSDKYLFLRVSVIAAPAVVLLIVQSAAFPLTLRTVTTVDKVCNSCVLATVAGTYLSYF